MCPPSVNLKDMVFFLEQIFPYKEIQEIKNDLTCLYKEICGYIIQLDNKTIEHDTIKEHGFQTRTRSILNTLDAENYPGLRMHIDKFNIKATNYYTAGETKILDETWKDLDAELCKIIKKKQIKIRIVSIVILLVFAIILVVGLFPAPAP